MTARLVALAALVFAAQPALAQSGGAEATLFDFPNFQGQSVQLRGEARDLTFSGFDDKATSIRIESGDWEACSEPDFGGACRIIGESAWDLADLDFNNTISSIRPASAGAPEPSPSPSPAPAPQPWPDDDGDRSPIYPGDPDYPADGRYPDQPRGGPAAELSLYAFERYEGFRVTLEESTEDLRYLRFANEARSARVAGGAWRLCDRPNFGGRCVVVEDDVPDLAAIGLAEAVASVELLRDGPGRAYDPGRPERLDGYKAGFFPDPPLETDRFAAERCLEGNRNACEAFADAVCRSAGYRQGAWYTRDTARGDIRDVLCVRD